MDDFMENGTSGLAELKLVKIHSLNYLKDFNSKIHREEKCILVNFHLHLLTHVISRSEHQELA